MTFIPLPSELEIKNDIGNPVPTSNSNIDVALSTRLKPADTLAGITTVGSLTSITNTVTVTGPLTDTQLRATAVPSITVDKHTIKSATVNRFGEFRVSNRFKLTGSSFFGNTKDPNFWSEVAVLGATATQQNGEILLSTNTTANATITYQTVHIARWLAGTENGFRGVFQLSAGAINNLRRWGVAVLDTSATPVPQNGAWFQINGTTVSIAYRSLSLNPGGPVVVNSSAWLTNTSFNAGDGNIHSYDIAFNAMGADFYIDDILVYRLASGIDVWADTLHFKSFAQNINSGSEAGNHTLMMHVCMIARSGVENTSPIAKYIPTATTTICKYGPGVLHNLVVGNKINNAIISVYDDIVGTNANNLIAVLDGANILGPSGIDHIPFQNGLTIVTDSANRVTVVYE